MHVPYFDVPVSASGTGREAHMDRRLHDSEKTVARLQETLLDCLEEKTYDQITVTEIAGKAKIRRTTFYYFYGSLDELLQETWRTQLGKALPMLVRYLLYPCSLEEYRRGMQRMTGRKSLIRAVIQAGFGAEEVLSDMLGDLLKSTVHVSDGKQKDAMGLFSAIYGGCVRAVVYWWMEHGLTADMEMAYTLSSSLRSSGLAGVLGYFAKEA